MLGAVRSGYHQGMERIPDSDLPDTERATAPAENPDLEDPDFADEHTDLTFADDDHGGPERVPEPESPRGYSGMDA